MGRLVRRLCVCRQWIRYEYSESDLRNRTERFTSTEGITSAASNNTLLFILNVRNCHVVHKIPPPVNMESPKCSPHIITSVSSRSISMPCSFLGFSRNFCLRVFSANFFGICCTSSASDLFWYVLYVQRVWSFLVCAVRPARLIFLVCAVRPVRLIFLELVSLMIF
jgi:hypothetical protein